MQLGFWGQQVATFTKTQVYLGADPDLDPSFQKEGLVGRGLWYPAEWSGFYLPHIAHYFLEESNSCDSLSLVLNGWWQRQSWRYSQLLHFAPLWNKVWPKHCIPVPRLDTGGNLWQRFELFLIASLHWRYCRHISQFLNIPFSSCSVNVNYTSNGFMNSSWAFLAQIYIPATSGDQFLWPLLFYK